MFGKKRNVLIVVDMQNDFIDGALGTPEAVAIVPKVIEKIKNFKGVVFYTRDTHESNYLKTQEGRNLPVKHCIRGSHGWQLQEEIDRLRNEATPFDKETFGSTEMAEIMSDLDEAGEIGTVTLIGLCTDICVISNAMLIKAFLPETQVIVDAKCCAGVTPESHENALKAMEMCQIKVER